jgi:predicted CopG family antitoxin
MLEPIKDYIFTLYPSCMKTIKVSDETHEKIIKCGRMNESFDDVISKVFEYYIKRELKGEK